MKKIITIITILSGIIFIKKIKKKKKNRFEIDTHCVVFYYQNKNAKSVAIAGDFNNWDPTVDKMFNLGNGKWGLTLYLASGRYEYKFFVDEKHWVEDPNAVEIVDDGYRGKRSVIYVE